MGVLICAIVGVNYRFVNNITAFVTIALCVINMLRSKNNILFFLLHFQIFYYNYSVIFSRYLYVSSEYLEFYNNVDEHTYGVGIICLFIFELCLVLCYKSDNQFDSKAIYAETPNNTISAVLMLVSILIGVLGFDWTSFGTRGAVSSYYEYIGILLILGLHYSGYEKHRIIKYGYLLLILFLIVQGLIFGERIASLQFIFIWVFFFLGHKIKTRHILLSAVVGIFLMAIIGAYRSTFVLSNFTISSIWDNLTKRMLTFNGADLGYYCSLTFVMVTEKVNWSTRLILFLKFLVSIIVGNSADAYLPNFTRQFFSHWNGGYYPLYFYFYSGIVGTILMCFGWCKFICNCLSKRAKKHKDFLYLLGLYLVCITARWYMYSPLSAFRPVILFSIAYFVLTTINGAMYRKKGNF